MPVPSKNAVPSEKRERESIPAEDLRPRSEPGPA